MLKKKKKKWKAHSSFHPEQMLNYPGQELWKLPAGEVGSLVNESARLEVSPMFIGPCNFDFVCVWGGGWNFFLPTIHIRKQQERVCFT